MWKIVFGDPKVPKATWETYDGCVTDPKAGAETVKRLNKDHLEYTAQWEPGGAYYTPPSGYRGHYVNWDRLPPPPPSLKWRYCLMKVPKEEDFLVREAARTDNPIWFPEELANRSKWPVYLCAEFRPPNMVSYFSNIYDAIINRRTQMKLGRFMNRWSDLTDNEIADYCAKIGVKYGDSSLKFAETREDIRYVYENGPNSCMSYKAQDFGIYVAKDNTYIHPVEVYAGADTMVAYLERDGDITARAVVHRHKKQYVTIYGDSLRMEELLSNAGYTQDSNALGEVKLLRLVGDYNRLVCPYLDGRNNRFEVKDDHLLIIEEPLILTSGTAGYVII